MVMNYGKMWSTTDGVEEKSKVNSNTNCREQLPPIGAEKKVNNRKHRDYESDIQTSKGISGLW